LRVLVELGVELGGGLRVSEFLCATEEGKTYSLDDVGIGGNGALEELVKGLDIVGL
jgi:hypothetical protein